ncbi:DNA ligase [Helicobacter anatolicus]|uniref:DNA ligase n=1 Tax=Helicobacter anatolicus TaxID=2905874 RepID=UPI001E59C083|nr:DNA ligase [Helicobacter anatolicus]MCE3039972.1 DNA ligase [Helicobacter anatolicus]
MLKILFFCLFAVFAFCIELFQPVVLEDLTEIDARQYLVSEKLDGMRAYWNGKQLISKSGRVIEAPEWFIQNLPPFCLDGELYTKRKDFEHIISIIKSRKNQDSWKELKYYIFELPYQAGNLKQRLQVLKDYLLIHSIAHVKIIPQYQFQNTKEIEEFFLEIKKLHGEGIVLRKNDTPYQTGRSQNALKYKVFLDSECEIIGYKMGKKSLKDKVGSFVCKEGERVFNVGSGLDNKIRENPPPLGTIITYKYYQTTKNNLPKHPVFLRVRNDF